MPLIEEPAFLVKCDESGQITHFYTEQEVRDNFEQSKRLVDDPEETWKEISSIWKKEDYVSDVKSWEKRKLKIVTSKSHAKEVCKKCGTMWSEKGNAIRYEPPVLLGKVIRFICHNCDRSVQPHVSNPKNKDLVLKYIPEEFHEVIFGQECMRE